MGNKEIFIGVDLRLSAAQKAFFRAV